MLDPKLYRENPDLVREGLRRRGASFDLDGLLRLDAEKRALGAELDGLKAERNAASEAIAQIKRGGGDASAAIEKTRATGERIRELQARHDAVEARARDLALLCPNLPDASVPDGKSSADNRVVSTWGQLPDPARAVPDHLEIGRRLGLFDFERGAKISGSGFPIYTGMGARLERALINFFLDAHAERFGFTEVSPPYLVSRETMTGTGQLPKFEADMYRCDGEDGNRDRDLFLVPTAEVPVTNMHAGEILDAAALPLSYCAYTACFRREAGSWGADTRGFLRLHQFDKVEMVKFAHPDKSWEGLEELRGRAEELLRMLELPYRVLELCAGDLGFGAARCYDLEVWAPAEKRWLEVSSCSNFLDFQARRANIRCREGGRTRHVHTLNGSGLATPRVLVSLLETHWTDRGAVRIPAALRPWLGGREEIAAAA